MTPEIEELERTLSACRQEVGRVCGVAAARWWSSLFLTAYYTGARVGPLLAMRWESIDLERGQVIAEARAFDLPRAAIDALCAIEYPRRELVWPWNKSKVRLWQDCHRVFARAGLPLSQLVAQPRWKPGLGWWPPDGAGE